MGQDPSRLSAFLLPPQSSRHSHQSRHSSLFRHSAPPPAPTPALSHSLSDLRCQKPSYILPRVTKLRDAKDKGAARGLWNNKSGCLFVTDLHTSWKSDWHLSRPRKPLFIYIFFVAVAFFGTFSSERCQLVGRFPQRYLHRPPPPPPPLLLQFSPLQPKWLIKATTTTKKGRKKEKELQLYIQMP